MRKRM